MKRIEAQTNVRQVIGICFYACVIFILSKHFFVSFIFEQSLSCLGIGVPPAKTKRSQPQLRPPPFRFLFNPSTRAGLPDPKILGDKFDYDQFQKRSKRGKIEAYCLAKYGL